MSAPSQLKPDLLAAVAALDENGVRIDVKTLSDLGLFTRDMLVNFVNDPKHNDADLAADLKLPKGQVSTVRVVLCGSEKGDEAKALAAATADLSRTKALLIKVADSLYQTSQVDSDAVRRVRTIVAAGRLSFRPVNYFLDLMHRLRTGRSEPCPLVSSPPPSLSDVQSTFTTYFCQVVDDNFVSAAYSKKAPSEANRRDGLLFVLQHTFTGVLDKLKFHCEPSQGHRANGLCQDGPAYVDIMSSVDLDFDPRTKPFSLVNTRINVEMKSRIEKDGGDPLSFDGLHSKTVEALDSVSRYATLRYQSATRRGVTASLWPSVSDSVWIISDLLHARLVHVSIPTADDCKFAAEAGQNMDSVLCNGLTISPPLSLVESAGMTPSLEMEEDGAEAVCALFYSFLLANE